MTAPGGGDNVVGRATIEIIPEVKRFANELRRQLHTVSRQMRTLERDIRPVNNALRFLARNATGIVPGIKLASAAFRALAGEAIIGGILSLAAALYEMSGALFVVPAGMVAIGAASATLKIGLMGVEDALKAFGKGPAEFAESLENLSVNARRTGQALEALRPRLAALKNAVQQQLFAGMNRVLSSTANVVLPILRSNFTRLARVFNVGAKDLAAFVRRASTLRDMRSISNNIVKGFAALRPAIKPASQAILDLVQVGSTFLPQIGERINDLAIKFSGFISRARETGQLQQWIAGGLRALEQLGRIIGDVVVTLHTLLKTARESGLGLLDTFEKAAQKMRDWVQSARGQERITQFLEHAKQAAQTLLPIIGALISVFVNHLLPVLTSVGKIIGPSVERFIRALGEAIDIARPGIEAFAQGFSLFIDALIPALPAIAELVGAIGRLVGALSAALGPAIASVASTIANVLTPVIDFLANVINFLPDGFFKFIVALGATVVAIRGVIAAIRGFAAFGSLLSIPVSAGAAALTGLGIKANVATLGLRGFVAALGPIGIALAGLTLVLTLFGDHIGTALNKARDGFDNVADSISGVEGGMATLRDVQDTSNDATLEAANANNLAAGATDTYKLAIQGLKDAQLQMQQQVIAAANSQIGFEQAIDAATEAARRSGDVSKRNHTIIDISNAKGQQAKQTLVQLASQTLLYVADQKKAGASTETLRGITERGRQALIRTATQMGLSRTAAINLANSLLGIKSREVHVKVTGLGTAIGAVGDLREHLNSLTDVTVNVGVNYPSGLGLIGNTGARNTRQHGGPVRPNDWTLVGEQGPELVAFGRAARVFSNRDSMNMLTSGDEVTALNRLTGRPGHAPAGTRSARTDPAPTVVNVETQPEVRVFVGDREIKDVVVQVMNQRDRQTQRIMRAGGGIRTF